MNVDNHTPEQIRFLDEFLQLRSCNPDAARKIVRVVHLLHENDQHTQSLCQRFNAGEISAEELLSNIEDGEAQA